MCGRVPARHRGRVNSPGTGRTRRPLWRWAVDLVLIAAAVVSVLLEPVSIAWHSIIGLVFAGFAGPHLWHRRAWIRGTLRRLWQRRSLPRALRWSLSQAGLLLLLTVIVTASGLWDWLDGRTTIRWHAISSVILLAVLIRHTWTRRGRLLRPGSPRRRAGPVRSAGRWRAAGPPRSRSWRRATRPRPPGTRPAS
jgi:hypothetical protein